MIKNDYEWKQLVLKLAHNQSFEIVQVMDAAGYLWDSMNWERLRDTACGRFLREIHNKMPDPGLKAIYRKQVLDEEK